MNDYIIKTLFFLHFMMFDLKGHIRSNRALYVYIFSSNNSLAPHLSSPLSFSYSRYASLSFLSLLFFFSLTLFFIPPPPLHQPYIHPMPLILFSLSRLLLSFSFFPLHPPRPYISLCVFLFHSLPISFSIPLYFIYSFSISLSTSLFCFMETLFYVA